MWHEARKQERKIRGMIVDYRKRAERRQDFYEKIKADPTQFIQIHGRKCKIHLDPAVAAAGDGAAIIVPWQGSEDNLIDRFDVRAHLDAIPIPTKQEETPLSGDERHCNYERYRILAQNEFLGISEEKFLYQLRLEEQYGATAHLDSEKSSSKKKAIAPRAAISYTYDTIDLPKAHIQPTAGIPTNPDPDSDSEIDMDVTIDVNQIDTNQAHELNSCGRNFGMMANDFYSFLTKDADEAIALKMAKEVEQEKIMLSGRKSRRERRVQREKRLSGKPLSPPSYAAKEDISSIPKGANDDDESDSHSHSSETSEKITFITSFGGEDELQAHSKITINVSSKPIERFSSIQNEKRKILPKSYDNGNKVSSLKRATGSSSRGGPTGSSSRKSSNNSSHHRLPSSKTSSYHADSKSTRDRSPSLSSRTSSKISLKEHSKHSSSDVPVDKITSLKPSSHTNSSVREKVSPADTSQNKVNVEPVVPPIKRYYGRKRDDHSSSSDELTDYEVNSPTKDTGGDNKGDAPNKELKVSEDPVGKTVSTTTPTHSSSFQPKAQTNADKQNLRDRLKRKMQTLLNKQYKADKKAEMERTERQIQQQQEREDEMRELALKLRKRQRELRHKYGSPNSESSSNSGSSDAGSGSRSKWKTSVSSREKYRSRSRESRSRSYSHKDDDSPQRGHKSHRSRSGSRHRNRDYDYNSSKDKDYNSKDYASKDYSSRDYSSREYTSREYASKDHGSKDYRSREYDRRDYEDDRRDYASKNKDYGNKNKEYGSKDKAYGSKDKDYGSKDYDSKDKDYASKDKEYGSKDSGSSRRTGRVSRWDNTERDRYSPKRRYSRSRERTRDRSRSPRR